MSFGFAQVFSDGPNQSDNKSGVVHSDLRWMVIDLNSYFASVEQQLRPELRGKPIGIVPMMAESTSCLAASQEAKVFGIKTGVKVSDARRMCRDIVFVEARHRVYVEYHDKIVEAVESCHPVTSVMSIDEMALYLRGRDTEVSNAIRLAKEVKLAIRTKVGEQLTSSVGIAPNRFLAKMASDMQKPDGLVVLHKKDLPQKLLGCKPRDFLGIGPRMEERFRAAGITTTEQIYNMTPQDLRNIWGIHGERFYRLIRGEEVDVEFGKNKSIGHSHVLPPDCRNEERAHQIALKLLHKCGVRLRKSDFFARVMSFHISYLGREGWGHQVKFNEAQDLKRLTEIFNFIWKQKPAGKPLKVAISLSDFTKSENRNLSFFDLTHEGRQQQAASLAMDKINNKYGSTVLYSAETHKAKKAAPSRIAFSNIPTFDQEDD